MGAGVGDVAANVNPISSKAVDISSMRSRRMRSTECQHSWNEQSRGWQRNWSFDPLLTTTTCGASTIRIAVAGVDNGAIDPCAPAMQIRLRMAHDDDVGTHGVGARGHLD